MAAVSPAGPDPTMMSFDSVRPSRWTSVRGPPGAGIVLEGPLEAGGAAGAPKLIEIGSDSPPPSPEKSIAKLSNGLVRAGSVPASAASPGPVPFVEVVSPGLAACRVVSSVMTSSYHGPDTPGEYRRRHVTGLSAGESSPGRSSGSVPDRRHRER